MARTVTIEPVLNGFVCPDVRTLARAVEEYYSHPEEVEKRYREQAINRMDEPAAPRTNPQNLIATQTRDECSGFQAGLAQVEGHVRR